MRLRALVLAVLALAAAFSAAAHPQRVAIADIYVNERTGYIEVAHRFSLHDAEHALMEMAGGTVDLIGNRDDQAAFADYVAGKFTLTGEDDTPITLSLLGWELEDGAIWIYQQAPHDGPLEELTVSHEALREIWPDQQTLVTVYQGRLRKSLFFRGRDGAKTIGF